MTPDERLEALERAAAPALAAIDEDKGRAPKWRRQAPRILARAGPLPAGADTDAYWRRVLAGELEDAEARELDDYLARLAPASEPPPATADDDGDGDRSPRLLRTLAEALAEVLAAAVPGEGERDAVPEGMEEVLEPPFAAQRRLVREAIWFPDATLFDVLSQQSSEADPERGVELALLAIDSLAANEMLETHPAHASLAWTRLARARWRCGDPAAAEQDLERAAAVALAAEDGELPAAWEAERRRVEVAFHWLRGRWLQGLDVATHMVSELGTKRALRGAQGSRPAGTDDGSAEIHFRGRHSREALPGSGPHLRPGERPHRLGTVATTLCGAPPSPVTVVSGRCGLPRARGTAATPRAQERRPGGLLLPATQPSSSLSRTKPSLAARPSEAGLSAVAPQVGVLPRSAMCRARARKQAAARPRRRWGARVSIETSHRVSVVRAA